MAYSKGRGHVIFYRLYRPLGRVGTVIPDKFDLDVVFSENFDDKVGFFVVPDY
jgi:hypothetical protein